MMNEELLSDVAEHTGQAGTQEAEHTVHTVLEVLSERLSWPVIEAVADDLPGSLTAGMREGVDRQDFNLAEFQARVADRMRVPLGRAVELTGVVCRFLAEALSPGTLHRLREELPEPMGALFSPRESGERFEPVHLEPSRGTLAEGRPGSTHPLSEASPERAQSQSVARTDNPHGDTKLSSATGLTQEREGETLATGHLGSNRPLSERK
ncbi:hypothetical protein D187_002623 [Cystobacter fuscus DSM 2262]|uniref:DUF2267 domain-containing protein n=1 Tax=Cystobacter fuscus (strain ATCC 25194 / DSM 2262 / NBRC 100088 / M29) TaxID=1242864 RepID=S9QEW5_CYSF2|nr:DUF2267 domain-containing protein [Cystobacter fuscus]EPX59879.1 hypothetical protein D187_002623 [Cystobacter fuscus DSM 2262]